MRNHQFLVDADGGIAEHDLLRLRARTEEIAGGKHVDAGDLEIGGEHAAGIARALAGEAARQELRLLVGRLHQSVTAAAMLGALADGVHAKGVGFEMIVDHDAARDLKPGGARQRGVGADADRDDDGVGGDDRAVAQLHRLDPAVAGDAGGVRLQPDGDALGLDRALEHERRARIELALHQPVHEVEKRDSGAGLGEAVGGFEAEQPTADHHHARPCGFHCRNGVDVVHVAEGEDPGEIHAGNVGLDRLRPGGEDELGECKLRTA